ncbi:phosphatidylethanolamine-binding protein [Microdochium trichocladiopsis]|uniref:Phosphatidylethanolamine-binding protein n=1 Tax=Microdochium trichocladiopsis TaxID=1682393 RepID=A0A9P9BRI4_9PEZI|nr:phosphatidylethanolamine-binding protein [Microdochium trichocladiopsis]KAH7032951.1 phosphatidylethanolamine-binding protein [Microdochium trichocladiopsis]
MAFKALTLLSAAASMALALTPPGFVPASQNSLLVAFGNELGTDGAELQQSVTRTQPQIGTLSKLDGTSFAVFMIDLDIPTANPPATDTLLHWAQTGLAQSASPSNLGGTNAFLLTAAAGEAALVPYFGPNPPAKVPLTHRYTQILVDTTGASAANLAKLQQAVKAKQKGFDVASALQAAGLSDKVVAGNFFRVTNQQSAPFGSGNSTANPKPSNAQGTGGTGGGPKPTTVPIAGAAHAQASLMALGLGVVAAACWTL